MSKTDLITIAILLLTVAVLLSPLWIPVFILYQLDKGMEKVKEHFKT